MAKINTFGLLIDVPAVDFTHSLIDQVVKRNDERDIFERFLGRSLEGVPIKEHILETARQEAELFSDKYLPGKEEVVEAIIKKYKQAQSNGLTVYDNLVFSLIQAENGRLNIIKKIKEGKVPPDELPPSFPGMRKRAEVLLRGKVASDIKRADIFGYLTEKIYLSRLRFYARDLFFAINRGLGEKSEDFLTMMFYLDQRQTSDPLTRDGLRTLIAEGLEGKVLELVHIKSLRFTYPGGRRLRVLEDLDEIEQEGLPGEKRLYPSEDTIFLRLNELRAFLSDFGINSNLAVIVSDLDVDYCFPEGQNLVPSRDVEAAQESGRLYVNNLRKTLKDVASVYSLSEFLTIRGCSQKFVSLYSELVREGERGGGRVIGEKMLVARTDEQFQHYSQMFDSYSRNLAGTTARRQIASALALSAVFRSFPSTPLLIIDNRSFENKLIGGYAPDSVVKYFTRLKDPVKITKVV